MDHDRSPAGLASIIIPCWSQLEFTRQCIPALKRHTRGPWELIVIDNGSTDGTAAYLAGICDFSAVPVTVITNSTNLGFPAAINQGLRRARGDYLVLLNNDVVVTDGWLDQLIALVNSRGLSVVSGPLSVVGEGEHRGNLAAEGISEKPEGEKVSDGDCTVSTPPGPPFTRGGNVLVPSPRVDPAEADVEEAEPCAATSSLPTADCLLPTICPIGLAGPMSNYAAPPQLVEGVPYRDVAEMPEFARRWRDEHLGKWFMVPKLSGFCLLMKRAVYDRVGGLDERFGLGFFDDDDLAERARRAGFALAVAHDLFVHHFGSRTFAGNGINAGKLLDENARRFAEKWGHQESRQRRFALTPFVERVRENSDLLSERGHTRFQIASLGNGGAKAGKNGHSDVVPCAPLRRTARVSLTMIVKNEQENLPHCLESVRGVFDEIVVVDTGSTDRTREIAGEFGARVFEFPWIDDFAAARNEALTRATGDYAFWLDADDVVEPAERVKLLALLAGLERPTLGEGLPTPPTERPKVSWCPTGQIEPQNTGAAYVVRCACDPSPDGTGGDTVVDHIRLLPLRDDVRWTYRVHEQILPALRRANVPVRWTDLTVRHTGYVDKDLRARKLERDITILHRELEERPDDPFVLFNLGAIAVERCDWRKALWFLEHSLARSKPTDSIVRKLFALIARAHQMLGDTQAALRVCAKGLEVNPQDAELWFRRAVVHRHRGESSEADKCWRLILTLKRPDQFCSVDQGIYGHLTRRNLAILAAERGDHAETRRLWQAVLAECPGDRDAMARLGTEDGRTSVTESGG